MYRKTYFQHYLDYIILNAYKMRVDGINRSLSNDCLKLIAIGSRGDCGVCLLAVCEIHRAFGSCLHMKTGHKVQQRARAKESMSLHSYTYMRR